MSSERKKAQWKVVGLAGAGALGLFGILGWVMNNSQADLTGGRSAPAIDPTIISDISSSTSPELSWVTQSRQEIEGLRKDVRDLTSSITDLKTQNDSQLAQMRQDFEDQFLAQQQQINTVAGMAPEAAGTAPQDPGTDFIANMAPGALPVPGQTASGASQNSAPVLPGFGQAFTLTSRQEAGGVNGPPQAGASGMAVAGSIPPGPGGRPEDAVTTYTDASQSRVRKLGSYVPAGSYAPATVIAGVDASAGVKSQENPVPVLLRITGPVVTAANGAGAGRRVNLTGCTVLGSAAADLSAERVYVRLTTLTCVNGRNEVLETPVAGIVVGSGKAGVRGKVVSREGNLVRNAAIAGVLQGIGQTASASAQGITGSDNLDGTVSSLAGAAAAGAVGGGLSGAANTLAEYYIERAEQYQPVVSLYGGTDVEVVFLDGVDLR